MAPGGVLLGTKRRHYVLAQASLQTGDTLLKTARLDHFAVQDVAGGIVESVAAGPAAELMAEVDVLEPSRAQSLDQGLAVELRGVFGIRAGAHVGNHLDGMETEQFQETRHGMV